MLIACRSKMTLLLESEKFREIYIFTSRVHVMKNSGGPSFAGGAKPDRNQELVLLYAT
jgi:hypothetical protein